MLVQMKRWSWSDLKKALLPTRAMALLLGIGFVDLIATAVLHSQGKIVELNPLMKPFIEHSEWLFSAVKAATLIAAWIVMARYAKHNLDFVRKACAVGAIAYMVIWTSWFFAAS